MRDEAVLDLVVNSNLSMSLVPSTHFRQFCRTLDPRYTTPSRRKFGKLFEARYRSLKADVRQSLAAATSVSLAMDIWTKKGYTSSYLGVTACFFDKAMCAPRHVMLNLFTIAHPHTGDMISIKVDACLKEWKIHRNKVLVIITDNGSNMCKAVNELEDCSRSRGRGSSRTGGGG